VLGVGGEKDSNHVVQDKFDHKHRLAYASKLTDRLLLLERPFLVFLDPDTGFAPQVVKQEHVTDGEVKSGLVATSFGRLVGPISTRLEK
jgi:hypothetical protein